MTLFSYDDIVKGLSNILDHAIMDIRSRLLDWENGLWLKNTDGLFKILNEFDGRFFSDKYLLEGTGLLGWGCGLCQILDLSNKNICRVLPYLLTAYLFNFPDNKFVHTFLRSVRDKPLEKSLLYGNSEDKSGKALDKDEYHIGIGKLLSNQPDGSVTRANNQRTLLAQRFRFGDAKSINSFFLPAFRYSPFSKKLKAEIERETKGEPRPLVLKGLRDNYKLYSKDFLITIFSYFHKISCEYADEKPDALLYILLIDTLQDDESISYLKRINGNGFPSVSCNTIRDEISQLLEQIFLYMEEK